MDYKEELARLPWFTPKEPIVLRSISKKVLGLENEYLSPMERNALGVMDGLLANMAHNDVYDINIGYVKSFIGDRLISDLKQEFEKQIASAEDKEDDSLALHLQDYYDNFLSSGVAKNQQVIRFVANKIEEELSKSIPERYSEELFTAYFDVDDPRVPSYTVNYKELSGFDKCVRDFICKRLVEDIHIKGNDFSFKGLDNPIALLYRNNFIRGTVDGKTFPEYVEEQRRSQKGSADDGLRSEISFDIAFQAKDRGKAILEAGCRRAMLLLSKVPFFAENSQKLINKEDIMELVTQLKEKPYTREPEVLKRYPELGIVENFDIRDARKYLYRKFAAKPTIHFYARKLLAQTKTNFEKKGIVGAKDYLSYIISDGIIYKELRETCEYIKKTCFSLEKERQNIISKDDITKVIHRTGSHGKNENMNEIVK